MQTETRRKLSTLWIVDEIGENGNARQGHCWNNNRPGPIGEKFEAIFKYRALAGIDRNGLDS